MSNARIRVLMADDHRLVVEMLQQALAVAPNLEIVAIARNGAEAVARARELGPDVCLLDVEMPEMDGIDAARQIRTTRPQTRVIMLTAANDDDTLVRAVEVGVSGYLTKDATLTTDIIDAIRRAHAGEILMPPTILRRVLNRIAERRRAEAIRSDLIERLSPRETEILHLLATGADNKAIANHLVVSPNTVRTHVQHLLSKLGAHSKLEAVSVAARYGIINLQPQT